MAVPRAQSQILYHDFLSGAAWAVVRKPHKGGLKATLLAPNRILSAILVRLHIIVRNTVVDVFGHHAPLRLHKAELCILVHGEALGLAGERVLEGQLFRDRPIFQKHFCLWRRSFAR
jgi:hypothetical protein